MPHTLAQKILQAHTDEEVREAGQIVNCHLSGVLANDITGPLAIKSFRVYLCLMTLATVNKAAFIFLQSMGRAWPSTALSTLREIVFGVGLPLILPRIWGLYGILYFMPAADVLTATAAAVVLLCAHRELERAAA